MSEKISEEQQNPIQESIEEISSEELSPEIIDEINAVLNNDNLDDRTKSNMVMEIVGTRIESFSGPLPHPDILAGYEATLPGAAERILAMAEKEEAHRHELELIQANADSRDSKAGIRAAFIIEMTLILAGAILVVISPNITGSITGAVFAGGGLAGIATPFIKDTTAAWKQRKQK